MNFKWMFTYEFSMKEYPVLLTTKKFLGVSIKKDTYNMPRNGFACKCKECSSATKILKDFEIIMEFNKAQSPTAEKYEGEAYIGFRKLGLLINDFCKAIEKKENAAAIYIGGEANKESDGIYYSYALMGSTENIQKLFQSLIKEDEELLMVMQDAITTHIKEKFQNELKEMFGED